MNRNFDLTFDLCTYTLMLGSIEIATRAVRREIGALTARFARHPKIGLVRLNGSFRVRKATNLLLLLGKVGARVPR